MRPDHVTHPVVIGLDLSLSATGIAHADGSTETFRPGAEPMANYGMDRVEEIRAHVLRACAVDDLELVMLEGLALAGHDNGRQLAMLAGVIRMALYEAGHAFLIAVPGQLKKYATGSGKASKEAVVDAAQKRLNYGGYNNNEADALWLRAMGWELVGIPLVEVPMVHRDALKELFKKVPAFKRGAT